MRTGVSGMMIVNAKIAAVELYSFSSVCHTPREEGMTVCSFFYFFFLLFLFRFVFFVLVFSFGSFRLLFHRMCMSCLSQYDEHGIALLIVLTAYVAT